MHPILARLNNSFTQAVIRIVLFLLVLFGAAFLLTLLVRLLLPASFPEQKVELYFTPVVTLLGALIAHYMMLRAFDRKSWSEVGLGKEQARPRFLLKGFALGAAAIGIPCIVLLASNQLHLIPAGPGNSVTRAELDVVTFLPSAFFEELMTRGYLFMAIRQAAGWKAALIITSVGFGLLHMGNPNVDPESIVLVILAGFFLGAVFLATGSLFAAGMAHFGWNWVMGAVLHASVSGYDMPSPDFRVVDNGPDWLTGGAWGPEGGVAAGVGMMISFIYLYARRIRRLES